MNAKTSHVNVRQHHTIYNGQSPLSSPSLSIKPPLDTSNKVQPPTVPPSQDNQVFTQNPTTSPMASTTPLLPAIITRRTYYNITSHCPIPDSKIRDLVFQTTKYTPSAFNSQSARLVLFLGAEHEKLWDVIDASYKQQLSAKVDVYQGLHERFLGFRKGRGTVSSSSLFVR